MTDPEMLMQDVCAGFARWLAGRLGAVYVLTGGLSRQEYLRRLRDLHALNYSQPRSKT